MNIKIKRHTPVRMKKSDWHIFLDPPAYGHYGLPVHPQDIPRVKDLHTDLDPQVDAKYFSIDTTFIKDGSITSIDEGGFTPDDWYEDPLEYNRVELDKKWNKKIQRQIPRELTHWQRLTKLFKRRK